MTPFDKVALESLTLDLKDAVPSVSSDLWWSVRQNDAEQRATNWDAISLFLPQSFLSVVSESKFFGSKDICVFAESIVAYLESAFSVNATKGNAELFYRSFFMNNFVKSLAAVSPAAFAALTRDDVLLLRVAYRTAGYHGLVGLPKGLSEILDLHLGEPSSHKSLTELFGSVLWRVSKRLGLARAPSASGFSAGVPDVKQPSASRLSLVQAPVQKLPIVPAPVIPVAAEKKSSAKEELSKAPDLKIETDAVKIRSVLFDRSGFCVAKIKTSGPSPASCSVTSLHAASFDDRGNSLRSLSLDITPGIEKGALREFFEFFGNKPVFVHNASLASRFLAPLRTTHGVVDRISFYDSSVVASEAWPEARSDNEVVLARLLGISFDDSDEGLADCLIVGRMLSLGARRVGLERGAFMGDTRPR